MMIWRPKGAEESIRYEKKYLAFSMDTESIADYLSFNGYKEEYQPREVRNLYFDTETFSFYEDHLAGIMDRYKIRFRWYETSQSNFDLPTLEVKAKSGDIGYKYLFRLEQLHEKNKLNPAKIRECIKDEKLLRDFDRLVPKVFIGYKRRYFRHLFKTDLRITLDYEITCADYDGVGIGKPIILSDRTLCEVKYPPNANTVDWNSAFGVGRLNRDLDLQPLRFSKYVSAVERLF